jgi:N-acetylneuraminate synthase
MYYRLSTMPEQYGLNVIQELRKDIRCQLVFRSFCRMETCIAATALGPVFLNSMLFLTDNFGPDAKASLTIQETKELV